MTTDTILAVDESREIREFIVEPLQATDYEVWPAEDGVQGLKVATVHPEIDLFLMDMNMPNMNGMEIARKIRERQAHKTTKMVFLTT